MIFREDLFLYNCLQGVKSLDPSAIAFAPPAASAGSAHRWNPRVVAIGEGSGKILR